MLDSDYEAIKLLGMNGFSAKCVVKKLRDRVSISGVYRVWSTEKIKVWDYRHGTSELSKEHLRLVLPTIKRAVG